EDLDQRGLLQRFIATGVDGQAYSSYEYDYDAGVFAGSRYFFWNYEEDLDVNGRLTRVIYEYVQGQPYSGYEIDYAKGAVDRTKYSYTTYGHDQFGFSYRGYEED